MASKSDQKLLSDLGIFDPPPDILAARVIWEDYAIRLNTNLPELVDLHKEVIIGRKSNGDALKADISVPTGQTKELRPVVVYLHAGGWAFGSPTSFRKLGMIFAEHGLACINLDYPLAPELPFPSGLNDVLTTLDAIPGLSPEYGLDPSRVVLAGDSAGGNLRAGEPSSWTYAAGQIVCWRTRELSFWAG
jgi:acetyl esterase/lipase